MSKLQFSQKDQTWLIKWDLGTNVYPQVPHGKNVHPHLTPWEEGSPHLTPWEECAPHLSTWEEFAPPSNLMGRMCTPIWPNGKNVHRNLTPWEYCVPPPDPMERMCTPIWSHGKNTLWGANSSRGPRNEYKVVVYIILCLVAIDLIVVLNLLKTYPKIEKIIQAILASYQYEF